MRSITSSRVRLGRPSRTDTRYPPFKSCSSFSDFWRRLNRIHRATRVLYDPRSWNFDRLAGLR
jgi:hypothetical protein